MTFDDLPQHLSRMIPDDAVQPRWDDLRRLHELAADYDLVIEYGSGVSTVVFSHAVNTLISFEADPRWFKQTVAYLSSFSNAACNVSVVLSGLGYMAEKNTASWLYSNQNTEYKKHKTLWYIDGPELYDENNEVTMIPPEAHSYVDVVIDHRLLTRAYYEYHYGIENKTQLTDRLCLFKHSDYSRERRQ